MANKSVKIVGNNEKNSVCSLVIPNSLLYHWYVTRSKEMTYIKNLNSCIDGQAVMVKSTPDVEERLRMKSCRCFNNIEKADGKRKREKVISKTTIFHLYEDEILKPTVLADELSEIKKEIDESRLIIVMYNIIE